MGQETSLKAAAPLSDLTTGEHGFHMYRFMPSQKTMKGILAGWRFFL